MEEGSRIRVLIIDHSAFARAALPRLIEADPQLESVGVARDAEEGLTLAGAEDPDIVLVGLRTPLDDMPKVIERLIEQSPRPIVVLTPPDAGPDEQLEALEAGAVQTLPWDLDNSPSRLMAFQSLLTARLKAFGSARFRPGDEVQAPAPRKESRGKKQAVTQEEPVELLKAEDPAQKAPRPKSPLALSHSSGLIQPRRILAAGAPDEDRRAEVVVIGAGMTGAAALRRLVTQLPPNLNIALLGLVRLPEELLMPYAERLAKDSAMRVSVALEGDPIRPGVLLLAPMDSNMGLVRTGRVPKALVRLVQPEPNATVPSLDVTLRACSTIYGSSVLGLVLSGLSRDGVAGMQAVRAKGGMTAVLNPASAIVPGTNRMCEEAGAVDHVVDIPGAVALITRLGLRI